MKYLLAALLFSSLAFGQAHIPIVGPPGVAGAVYTQATAPAVCNAGDVYFDLNTNIINVCGPANTWSPVGTVTASQVSSATNQVLYATAYAGADAGAKMQACVTAAAAGGHVCDARGINSSLTISSTITIPALVDLKLPSATITANVLPAFEVTGNQSSIEGVPAKETIIQANLTNGAIIKIDSNVQHTTISDVILDNTSSSNAGSIALDLEDSSTGYYNNILMRHVETALQVSNSTGGTSALYNRFVADSFFDFVTGIHIYKGGNSNTFIHTILNSVITTGILIDAVSGSNLFLLPDVEVDASGSSTATAYVINGQNNTFIAPYTEGMGYPFNIGSGAGGNAIIGGQASSNAHPSVNSNTTNLANLVLGAMGGSSSLGLSNIDLALTKVKLGNYWLEPGQGSHLEIKNATETADDLLIASTFQMRGSGTGLGVLSYGGGNSTTFTFPSPLPGNSGNVIIDNATQTIYGKSFAGQTKVNTLANPSAPTITQAGTPGSTTYTYYVVCHDANGGVSLPSSAGTTTTGSATLDTTNYNKVVFSCPTGYLTADILSGDTAHLAHGGGGIAPSTTFNDQSNTTSAYTVPTRNSTGDMIVGGTLRVTPTTVSAGPTCSSAVEGRTQPFTDSTVNTWGTTIAGGGANHVLGYCDGTNWTVAAP